MRTKLHHILSSGLFTSIILFLFLGSSYTVLSQEQVIPITDPAITTWTVPAGVTSVTVECWGAGGSGGSSRKNKFSGGGGGGAYSRSLNIVVIPNTTVDIQIGLGGASVGANTDGNSGTGTWFINSGTVFAEGGSSGSADTTGGAGGNAANGIGDITFSGGAGANSTGTQGGGGGYGAGTEAGGTAASGGTGGIAPTGGGNGGDGGNTSIGLDGFPPGGGGGGGSDNNAGGAGADGQIVITYTVSNDPTITLGTFPEICEGITSANLPYSATTNSPDLYSIDYVDASFTDIVDGTLNPAPSNIPIAIPPATTSGVYDATLTVTNSGTSTTSGPYPFTVTVIALPSAPGTSPITYCEGDTASALTATGTNLLWYTTPTGGTGSATAPTPSTASAGSTTYYVSQTVNNCEGPRASLIVTVNALPSAPVTSPVTYCEGDTSSALTATGTSLLWYTVPTGGTGSGTAPTPSTASAGSTTYYVSQTVNNCEGPRASLIVTVNALPSAPGTSPVTYCEGDTASALTATGTNLLWYTTPTGGTGSGTAPTPSTVSAGTTTYYVSQTVNNCEGPRATLVVTVNAPPTPAVAGDNQTISVSSTTLEALPPDIGTGSWSVVSGPSTSLSQFDDTASNTALFTPDGGNGDYVLRWTISNDPCSPSTDDVTITVNVIGNNAPIVTVPATQNVCEGSTLTLGNPPSIADADNDTQGVTITITNGTLDLVNSGVTISGDGTSNVTITNDANATLANINNAFNGAIFTPSITSGTANVQIATNDGNGGTDTKNFDITVNALPSAPGTSPVTYCEGDTASALTATGTNLLWYTTPTGGTGSGTAPTPSTVSAGTTTYYVSQTVNNCEGPRASLIVTVNAPPSTADAGANQNISVSSTTLEALPPDIGTGVWSVTSGPSTSTSQFSSTTSNTATFTPTGGVGDYVLRWTISNAPCTDSWSEVTITTTFTPSNPPTITLTDPNPLVVQGGNSTNLIYIATTNNPDFYSITYDAAALGQLFVNVTDAPLPVSPIALNVPQAALLGTYNGILTVKNSITTLTSGDYPITITVTNTTDHSLYNCTSCHITHTAPGTTLTTVAGNALLCQSCHISTGAASAKPLVDGIKATPGVGGNSHSWDVSATNTTYETVAPAPTTAMGKRLPEGNIICSTCHNQHSSGAADSPYLRVDNTGDAMCKVCHTARDVGIYTDAPATNKGSHPVGIDYTYVDGSKLNLSPTNTQLVGGKVECSSCHGVHDVDGSVGLTTDGNLLRTPNTADAALCKDCHIDMTHNGMNCLDCHQVHNTNKSNLYMIKSTITTPNDGDKDVVFTSLTGANNFADGDGIDGVCEVCHRTTDHFRNSDNLTGVPDQLHTNQGVDIKDQNCTTCHEHGNSFAGGGGSCLTCHSSVKDPVNRAGAPQIVGTGGEFDPVLTSRHTPGGNDPTDTDCAHCHTSAGTHSADAMELRDVDDEIEPFTVYTGDTDLYCVKCHDASPPTGITFPGSEYNKASFIGTPHDYSLNSCMQCHNRHGSSNANLLAQASNLAVCNACHTSGGDAATINIDTWTSGGNSHAWNASATNATFDALPPLTSPMSTRLEGSNIVCSTCHDPHSNTNGQFLVNANTSDQMCKDCHRARDIQRYQDDVANKGSHPVGVVYSGTGSVKATPTGSVQTVGGNVECSSCHQPHNAATSDGTLLRQANDVTLCTDCHTYGTHNNMNCLDCHEVHNTGSNNLYLIKEQIVVTTPAPASASIDAAVVFTSRGTDAGEPLLNSFADGNGTYNGVCEVCHTDNTNNYHYNTSAGDHTHEVGRTCTDCHTHSTNFAKPNCHSCHDSSSPFRYPLLSEGYEPGSHQIHVEQYEFTCNTCHFGHGSGGANEPSHSSGTKDVVFNPNGQAALLGANPTWNSVAKTCDNVYCHSNGDGGGDYKQAPSWITGSINSCDQCHTTFSFTSQTHPGTGAHEKHAGTQYGFNCTECHMGYDDTTTDINFHNNGSKEPVFNTSGINNRNGNDSNTPTYEDSGNTCSNIYCHSTGTTANRFSEGVAVWNSSASTTAITYATTASWKTGSITACNACHEGPATLPASPNYTIVEGNTQGQVTVSSQYPNTGAHGSNTGAHNSPDQLIILTEDGTYGDALPHNWPLVQCFWCHNNDAGAASGVPKKQGTYGTDKHVDGKIWFYPSWYGYGGHGEYDSGGKAPAYYTFDTEAEVIALGPPYVWHPESANPDNRPSMIPGLGYQWSGPTNTHCGNGKNCW